jgi:hypothetical protein
VNQPRGTQCYQPTQREDEDRLARLTQAIISLASQYGRYGYRRITALLQRADWQVGKDRVERIWRREGLEHLPNCCMPKCIVILSVAKNPRILSRCYGLHHYVNCSKGAAKTEAAWAAVAQHWIVRAAEAGTQEPRVELRLRQR